MEYFAYICGKYSYRMETLQIQLMNPQAKVLLQDLAALKLITIRPSSGITELLSRLRNHADTAPSLDEITQEVETARSVRYAKK
jgi:hypothetical protein